MKKKIFTAVALFFATGTLHLLQAQAENSKTMSEDSWTTCKVTTTPTGCDFVFTNNIKSPRDAASGLPTGKRMHKPMVFKVSAADNAVTEIVSPRDIPSGQPTGKVSMNDISVTRKVNGSTVKIPVENGEFTLPAEWRNGDFDIDVSWSWGEAQPGAKKAYAACHFALTIQNGTCMAINTKGTGGTKSNVKG